MHAFKQAVAVGDLQQLVDDASALLDQALAVLPVVADEEASQDEIIAAARQSAPLSRLSSATASSGWNTWGCASMTKAV